jgi:hypothetical protein
MDHDDDKDWCSINEAARRLKVTPTAIRNRIKRGTLKTKPNGNYGRLVRVPLPVIPTVTLPVSPTGSSTVTGTMTPTVPEPVPLTIPDPLVPELRDRIGQLETQLKTTQDELLEMAQKVGATETELAALRARAMEIREDRDAWKQQAERLARPWWRRLAG